MASEYVLTRKGKSELENQLKHLKSVKRPEIAEQIKIARSFGDLSENAEYIEARNEQSRIEGKIIDLEKILRSAAIVNDNEINLEQVGIGTKVRLLDLDINEEESYSIVGSNEVDIDQNKISNESPVGKMLIGRKVGDDITVQVHSTVVRFRIIEISKADG